MIRTFALALLLHAYIGARLLPDLPGGVVAIAALALWLAASALLTPVGLLSRRGGRTRLIDRLALAGLVAMGSFSSLLVLTVLRDVSLLAGHALAAAGLPSAVTTWRAVSAGAVPLLAAALTIVGWRNARRRARVRHVDVPIASLPDALHGFTIAQISDLHIGPTIRRPYVEAVVDAVNALGADLIAVTGDLVDGAVRPLAPHTEPLAQLRARHGAYFVTGNHEYYSGATAWVAEIDRLGMRVLLNEHVVLDHQGAALVIAGVTDFGAHHFDPSHRSDPHAALAGAPPGAALRLLLAHQPRSAHEAARAGYHLQLSGHTHGGQFLPWNWLVRFWQPFTAGLHRLGDLWVYTSRGTGYWGPPKRLGAPSEITRLRLIRAPATAAAGP
jgi:predicted MPP superfamily phosphohydrolase